MTSIGKEGVRSKRRAIKQWCAQKVCVQKGVRSKRSVLKYAYAQKGVRLNMHTL